MTDERGEAYQRIIDRRKAWNAANSHSGSIDLTVTIGEVENEILRSKGLDECPMCERDYSEGWR